MAKKKSRLNTLFLLLNILVIILLIISYFSPTSDPSKYFFPAFFGLVYPVLFILNMLFIFLWLLRWKIWFLLSLVAILAGWNIFFKSVAFNSEKPVGAYGDAMKVMSYNVRFFDQFN